MTKHDLDITKPVYHTLFPHWGEGKILRVRDRDGLGYKTSRKVLVKWQYRNDEGIWMRLTELRKTPKK